MISAIARSGSGRAAPPAPDRLVPRLLLGRELCRLRERDNVSRELAARAIGVSTSKIGRIELGRTGLRYPEVEALLTLYGVEDPARRAELLALAEQANEPAWWHDRQDVVPSWQQPYLSAEGAAKLVRCFDKRFVPALLRTEEYSREIVRLVHPDGGDARQRRRVELCLHRQQILRRRPRPVNLWAVLDEAVLCTPVGSRATLRAQLRHLAELVQRPNVTLQILPAGSAARLGTPDSLTLVRFRQRGLTDMVYLDRPGTPGYPHRQTELDEHWQVFSRLVTESAPPHDTPAFLHRLAATC